MSKYLDYFNKAYFQSKPIKVIKSQKELLLLLAQGYTLQKKKEPKTYMKNLRLIIVLT